MIMETVNSWHMSFCARLFKICTMRILEVDSPARWKQFHKVLRRVYANEPHYIMPLDKDIRNVFDPAENKGFAHGEACCFVLLDEHDQPAGRIAAFIEHDRNEKHEYPIGQMGYFECIENKAYAFALFEKGLEWLSQFDVKAVDAPVNLGQRDKFWGLLVKGYEFPPLYHENYHPPYYRTFFEEFGFQAFEQILTFRQDSHDVPSAKFKRVADISRKRYNLTSKLLKDSSTREMARDFVDVYNAAFSHSPYFKPLTEEPIIQLFKEARLILDPGMVIGVYHEDRAVGFGGFVPDINPFLKSCRGRLPWYRLPWFLYKLKTTRPITTKGLAWGVHPDFQGKGVYAVLVDRLYNERLLKRYHTVYMSTIRAHNKTMVSATGKLGGDPSDRIHQTYRKMLDETLPFEPFDLPYDV